MTTDTVPRVTAPPVPAPPGGRVQLALRVDDLSAAVEFYRRLFDTPPSRVEPGYARFSVVAPPLKLVLVEAPGQGGTVDHLGVEVPDSGTVHQEIARLRGAGLVGEEELDTTCCYARQDKVWVTAPSGERWEVYTVLPDAPAGA